MVVARMDLLTTLYNIILLQEEEGRVRYETDAFNLKFYPSTSQPNPGAHSFASETLLRVSRLLVESEVT